MRQEPVARVGQHGQPARPANLAIELDSKLGFERKQAVAQPLFRDRQHGGCRTDLPVTRDLDEGDHLIGAQVREDFSHTTIKVMISRINNYAGHSRWYYDAGRGGS